VRVPKLALTTNREERCKAAQRWNVDPKRIVLGFIGQLIPIKGLLELLQALDGISAEWALLVAGRDPEAGAPYESLCRRYVEERGWTKRVRFLGFLNDVTPFYQAIDLAVVPSLEEPLGRVSLEAAAYARPAIAFAAGGLPETIKDGQTGWLVAPGDVRALRETLAAFLEAPDPSRGLAARKWVESISDPCRYAARMAALYGRLLGGANLPSPSMSNGAQPRPNLLPTDIPAL
jgi:glycosyltransferase involved in cell wall biosynthesis